MIQGILLAISTVFAIIYIVIKLKPTFSGKNDCNTNCKCDPDAAKS